jgi:hypothetical protein
MSIYSSSSNDDKGGSCGNGDRFCVASFSTRANDQTSDVTEYVSPRITSGCD